MRYRGPGQNNGWEPERLAPTQDFEKGKGNKQVQDKVELPGSKIPSFFKMLKKIGYAQKNIICTALKTARLKDERTGMVLKYLLNTT